MTLLAQTSRTPELDSYGALVDPKPNTTDARGTN